MTLHDDQIITRRIPFLKAGTILYVAGADSTGQDEYIAEHESGIRDMFSRIGFRFIHLPYLLESIPGPVRDYLFPLQEGIELPAVFGHIRESAHLGNRAGLLYKSGRFTFFRDLPEGTPDSYLSILEGLVSVLDKSRNIRFRKTEPSILKSKSPLVFKKTTSRSTRSEVDEVWGDGLFELNEEAFSEAEKIPCPATVAEPPLDEQTAAILEDIDKITEKFGISIEELAVLIGYRVKLSHLHISRSGRILLSDFGKEVRMNQLSKALYFLFLRHPEGIRFKEVADHRAELLDIYLGITGREEQDEIERTIDKLIDPFGNEMNVCQSRIKAAFRNEVSDLVARFYCLEGRSGEKKKVPLDRDFVIWEN